jgi:hydrogenase nickel incorporation protein HypA/HybF
MHEFSIAKALITQIRAVEAKEGGAGVTAVEVEVGPLSGVESSQLAEAFHHLTVDSELSQAILHINQAPLIARCAVCQRQFEVNDYFFRCPECGDRDVVVEHGDGVIIRTVTIQVDSATEMSA